MYFAVIACFLLSNMPFLITFKFNVVIFMLIINVHYLLLDSTGSKKYDKMFLSRAQVFL